MDRMETETDSDRNEDPGREALLDSSFNEWINQSIDFQTSQQETLVQVPHDNVFDTAEDMDNA